MHLKKINVLGFDVDIINFHDALELTIQRLQENKNTHIVTINPEIIESAKKEEKLSEIIKNAQLVVADGSGIQLALKMKGINQERIPGIDLAIELINHCNMLNYSVALIGAKEEVIKKTVKNIEDEYENLNICYYRNGYFTLPIRPPTVPEGTSRIRISLTVDINERELFDAISLAKSKK